MRIIAGSAGGARLTTPSGLETRPTSDRVRESLYNILADRVRQARILDLFAGSGAVGLEALSRGAEYAVFSDIRSECIKAMRQNADKTRLADKTRILRMDASKAIAYCAREGFIFDLVYADPPYGRGLICETLKALNLNRVLTQDAVIIAERGGLDLSEDYYALDAAEFGFRIARAKRYGDTELLFILQNES